MTRASGAFARRITPPDGAIPAARSTEAATLERAIRLAAGALNAPIALVIRNGVAEAFSEGMTKSEITLALRACGHRGTLSIPNVAQHRELSTAAPDGDALALLCVPVDIEDSTESATLVVMDRRTRDWSPHELELASQVARGVSSELSLLRSAELQAERQVELSELLDYSSELIFSTDLEDALVYVNGAWLQALGYDVDSVGTLKVADLVAPGHRNRYEEVLRRVHSGAIVSDAEFVLLAANGQRVVLRGRSAPRLQESVLTGARHVYVDVTEARRSEAVRSRLAATLEATTDLVAITTQEGKLVYLNRAGRELLGLLPDSELVEVDLATLWSDSELARIVDEVVPAAVRDGTWEGETTLIIPGGENVPVSLVLVAHPSTWEGEPPYFISAVIRDLRERVAGERALRDSESRKQSMLDTALDCVLSIDHEGRITEFNPAAETTFGYLREEVIGKRIADVLVPERLRDVHRFDFEHNLATGESHMLGRLTEMVALRGDGSEFVCEYSITRLPIEGPPSYTAFMRDITARKRLQESLAAEREFLRAVLENLSEGVAVADAQGEHALLNRSLRTMLGLHQGNAPTRLPFLRDLYQDDGVTPLLPEDMPLVRANRGEEVDDVELIHAPPGRESRTLLANARRIVDSSGQHQGAVVALHDITERRRAERLRSQLIRTVSHELRTPLTAIRGSLEMLEKKSESLGDSGRALLGMALRNASHLARMVNDLLDVERIESGTSSLEQEWVETRSLIDAARDITTAVAESARVRVEAEGEPLKVWADPDRIVQVLTNLIGNAVKFSPPDSTIRVSASMFDDDTAVCFTVKDEGRGIPADRLDSIFEPFEQVEAKDAQDRGGFGLGLAICRAIVRQHRGTIWADSEPGQGSTFRFVLPANFDQDS